MYIDELETPLPTEDKPIGESLSDSDPMDSLIKDLRGEFKRQLARHTQEREAAKRKRLVAFTLVMAPMGLMMAAALMGRVAAHPKIETGHQETHYGH